MAVFAILTYDITDPERYSKYVPGSVPTIFGTIKAHSGETLFADNGALYQAGDAKSMNVCIKFPSVEDFHNWENDPEYAKAKAHRLASTTNYTTFIAHGLMPAK